MALIKCQECEKEISDKAATCPGCGAPVSNITQAIPDEIPEESPNANSSINLEAVGFAIILGAFVLPFTGISSNIAWTTGFIGFVVFIMGRFQK